MWSVDAAAFCGRNEGHATASQRITRQENLDNTSPSCLLVFDLWSLLFQECNDDWGAEKIIALPPPSGARSPPKDPCAGERVRLPGGRGRGGAVEQETKGGMRERTRG
ncbi:hypothetical protein E2C01_068536 [Portunus trituberculatus]|uniref:Uncharacterized protein n=1 Tax=Portunus trituberculatus TaxID=210409 RepID=A0A5B7HWR4_PORTR|nr:hypothetical protein [Portunus trituberculatus]